MVRVVGAARDRAGLGNGVRRTPRELVLRCGNRHFTRTFTAFGTGQIAAHRPLILIYFLKRQAVLFRRPGLEPDRVEIDPRIDPSGLRRHPANIINRVCTFDQHSKCP
jgi:hypothetical protein